MKFAIDRIEDNIVVLENIENNEIINVNINELPIGISEKNIIYYDGKKYYLDEKEKYNRLLRIREKKDRLKN